MRHALAPLACLVLLAACGGPEAKAPTPKPTSARDARARATSQVLSADTLVSTPSGAVFQAAKGWTLSKRDDGVLSLVSPEKDVTLYFVENEEPDGERAIGAAWKKADPAFSRAIDKRVPSLPSDGWDAITQLSYVTKSDEARGVVAIARKKGKRQYVVLVDGAAAGLDRRAAQLATAVTSLRAKGTGPESFAGKEAHALAGERLASFEAFVEEARVEAGVPGAAVAILQGGEVVLAKGFGVRELGKPEPVTPETLFMIGSTTKSLTTLMMARLVDAKKLEWTTPIEKLLPGFAFGDAKTTSALTVQRTVCACTGLPRQDMELLFEWGSATAESRVASMRDLRPTTAFGETFQYSNIIVAAGGYAAARAAVPKKKLGVAYASALKDLVLDPLGMRATTLDPKVVAKADHATPHNVDPDFQVKAIPLAYEGFVRSIAPSGGAWSNLTDMIRVLRLELGKGELDGARIVSAESLLLRRTPQVKITSKLSYGLGLFVDTREGVLAIGHGGNTLGFTSDFVFLPEHGVGMVVLANAGQANAFRSALRRRLVELLFDGRAEAKQGLSMSLGFRKETLSKEIAKVTRQPDAKWVAGIAGKYDGGTLGEVTVRADGDGALIDVGEWTSHVGEKTEEDGAKKLFFLDPPFVGIELLVRDEDGEKTLVLQKGQDSHVLSRKKK